MPGKRYQCLLTEKKALCSSTVQLKFQPNRSFSYEPGQFVSLVVPEPEGASTKRLYSLASAPNQAKQEGYELCVRLHEGGLASEYIRALSPGDHFEIFGPYGDFVYQPQYGRSACFIANGTGVAPVRSILQSKKFTSNRPDRVECILGFRSESEVLYAQDWEKFGVDLKIVLKRRIPEHFPKLTKVDSDTDFYLVGSPGLVSEMTDLLRRLGVPEYAIHKELFSGKK